MVPEQCITHQLDVYDAVEDNTDLRGGTSFRGWMLWILSTSPIKAPQWQYLIPLRIACKLWLKGSYLQCLGHDQTFENKRGKKQVTSWIIHKAVTDFVL